MGIQKPHQVIYIDPDFRIAFFLAFIKHQLQTEMQMDRFNIVRIFLVGIACPPHKADKITGLHDIPF